MAKAVQIRNVPDDVHKKLRIRAAGEGLSLSEYLLRELTRMANTTTPAELMERVASRPKTDISTQSVVNIIRETRDREWPS
jgi:plasmid stability protein